MRRPPLRRPLAALALIALSAPAVADTAPADPAADARFAAACMGVHLPSGTAAVEQRCVGLIALSCGSGAEMPGQTACLGREAEAWTSLAATALTDLSARAATLSPPAAEALTRAQSAWDAFAAAECAYAAALWSDPAVAALAAADCGLNTAARRAIQLRAQLGPLD